MSEIESAIVGYISGFFVGSLIILIIIGWLLITNSDDLDVPDFYDSLEETVLGFYESHPQIFGLAFIFGFLSGIASGGKAATSV